MTGKSGDPHLDLLGQRFQALRDQAAALPESCQELEPALKELSQAIAALRAARVDGADLAAPPGQCKTILQHLFSAIPDLLTVIDRDFNIIMSNWHVPDPILEKARRGPLKCYRTFYHRDRPCEDCQVRAVFATGQPHKVEKISEMDGRLLEFSAFPILDESGQVILVAQHVRDVTERHQAEQALKESEARFRSLFEFAPDAYFLMDLQGNFLDVNRSSEEIGGYDRQEVIGKNFQSLPLLDDGQNLEATELLKQAQPGKILGPVEYLMTRKDGGQVIMEAKGLPLQIKGEGLLLVIARNITARKQADEALREREATLRALIESNPESLFLLDTRGVVLASSKVAAERIGKRLEEVIGADAFSLVPPEVGQKRFEIFQQVVASGQLRRFEDVRENFHLDIWMNPIFDQGKVVQVAVLGVDITARKQVEAALRESEQRFRLMAETIQDVFWIASPGMEKTIYLSPGYEQVWGRPREELYDNPQAYLETIHPEDRDRITSTIFTVHQKAIPWSLEYRIIKPDGAVRWIHDRGFPVRDAHGRVSMFTGVATDITERQALEQQLLQAQKMEAVGRLAGGVAHDFNNLLMAITGYGELMRAKVIKGDPIYDHLENILKAGDRAAALTQQLLTFSRRQIVHPQVVDLNRVVLDLEPMLRRLIGEDLDLEVMTARESGVVKADPGHLGQIIMNLVVNARDAMPKGGRLSLKTATVEFKENHHTRFGVAPPGAYVRLEVRDAGVGMDEATQAHVFEPFFTTKEPGKGTGLGLSTVYGIVKQSGGYLDLASQPGAGSIFTIYLPRLTTPVEPPQAKIPITASFRGEETILLVEDEDVLRNLLAKFLRLYGYSVLEARHAGEALLACEQYQGPIHVLVTDVVMPQMSGRELADRLTPLRPDMKVLFMSGYTDDALVQHGVADRSMPFLQKPFKPIELARRVHAVLNPPVGQ